jgi:hypothetical protein
VTLAEEKLRWANRVAAKAKTEELGKFETAIKDLKAALKVTRTTLSLQESETATAKAITTAAALAPLEQSDDKETKDSVKNDSTKSI